jgi:hypothetical protein
MLLQTNSYIVPKDRRAEHARLLRRFRQALARVGCDHFEVYEQVGSNWSGDTTGRFVQIMRFRDRQHQLQVQAAERQDSGAQDLIKEFCELINFPYQQQQGLFALGYYQSALPAVSARTHHQTVGDPLAGDEDDAVPKADIFDPAKSAASLRGVAPREAPSDPAVEQRPPASESSSFGVYRMSLGARKAPEDIVEPEGDVEPETELESDVEPAHDEIVDDTGSETPLEEDEAYENLEGGEELAEAEDEQAEEEEKGRKKDLGQSFH